MSKLDIDLITKLRRERKYLEARILLDKFQKESKRLIEQKAKEYDEEFQRRKQHEKTTNK